MREQGQGGPVRWHKMGRGVVVDQRPGAMAPADDHAARTLVKAWEQISSAIWQQRTYLLVLDESPYPMSAGRAGGSTL